VALISSAITNIEDRAALAVERARAAIAEDDELPRVTLSVGICDTHHTADPTELVRLADRALYSSKESGRDQMRLYAPASTDPLAAT
jgi:PleD family two-component response regulator